MVQSQIIILKVYADEFWMGPLEKVWNNNQCDLLDEKVNIDLNTCKSFCQDASISNNRCTVIEYNKKSKKCKMNLTKTKIYED